MKLPLSWLKEFVSISLPPTRLAERLMMHGLEVESITDRHQDWPGVVVGEIVGITPHPHADHLRLASVRTTLTGKPLELVCGGPNIAVGQKVPVALRGAKLPNGLVVADRTIRGVVSNGMLCAEDELGLGTDHLGILILHPALKVGQPLASAIGSHDVVFDLAIPANRPDLLSVRGLAWEIATMLSRRFHQPPRPQLARVKPAGKSFPVRVNQVDLCPLYTARVITGVTVAPSPGWLERRLRAAGLRPVNAIVDATNYVMLEYGQPLHAFDAAKVHGGISVRRARIGERLVTLDAVARHLDASMLVIADTDGPIALAGVMGGRETEVTAGTTKIVLEAAIFEPVSIRRTTRRLGLSSEASKRFEKGIPFSLPDQASRAAAAMIVELCGGQVAPGVTVVGRAAVVPTRIKLSPTTFTQMLGLPVNPPTAKRFLQRLGFHVVGSSRSWVVTVPTWRLDISTPADVVDEVGRLLGYEQLPSSLPQVATIPQPLPMSMVSREHIRDILSGLGFTEVITHAYYGPSSQQQVGGPHVAVANPLDATQEFLRRSLGPSLDAILEAAADAGENAKIFQIGRIFESGSKPVEHRQPWKLAIGLTFKPPAGFIPGRRVRGVLEVLAEALGVTLTLPTPVVRPHKGRLMEWLEVDLRQLMLSGVPRRYNPLPKFPPIIRDLSFWLPTGVSYQRLTAAIRTAGRPFLTAIQLIDAYEVDRRRSLALRLVFQSAKQTLRKSDVDLLMDKIGQVLRTFAITLR